MFYAYKIPFSKIINIFFKYIFGSPMIYNHISNTTFLGILGLIKFGTTSFYIMNFIE